MSVSPAPGWNGGADTLPLRTGARGDSRGRLHGGAVLGFHCCMLLLFFQPGSAGNLSLVDVDVFQPEQYKINLRNCGLLRYEYSTCYENCLVGKVADDICITVPVLLGLSKS